MCQCQDLGPGSLLQTLRTKPIFSDKKEEHIDSYKCMKMKLHVNKIHECPEK